MLPLKKLRLIFFISIIVAFVFIIIAIVLGLSLLPDQEISLVDKLKLQKKYEIPEGNSYYLGSKNPKITMVVFSDFSCPVCKSFHPKLRKVILKYAKDIKIIYKDFPVVSENSSTLGLIARCAGEQGVFWEMHDELFLEQANMSAEKIDLILEKLFLDQKKFNTCLSEERYINEIKKDFALGQRLEIKGTPTLFINGYKLSGDIPEKILEQLITELLTS